MAVVSCTRTLGAAALAADNYFLEPATFRSGARSAGWARHSVRRDAGPGLDSDLPAPPHPHDAHGSCPRTLFHRRPDWRATGSRRVAVTNPYLDHRHLGVLLSAVWTEKHTAQRLAGRHRVCCPLRAASGTYEFLHGGGVADADSGLRYRRADRLP